VSNSHLAEYLRDAENLRGFQQERLLVEVASLIYQTMQKHGFTRSALATKLGVTKGRITQYLGGERNLTLRTLADIFTAMNAGLVFHAADLSEESKEWHDIPGLSTTMPLDRCFNVLDRWQNCPEGDDTPASSLAG
jgi:transcriptional regulator with XRE-family HTH domain